MARRIITIGVGFLMLCVFAVPDLFAQMPGGPFDHLSPGNQKGVRALFEAQKSGLPGGTRLLTLDEIAARKNSGEGWGRVFSSMKAQGLIDAENFGQVVSSFDERHHLTSTESLTTAANPPGRAAGRGR